MPNDCGIHIREVRTADFEQWRQLWSQYVDFLAAEASPQLADLLWHRIMDAAVHIYCMLAEKVDRQSEQPKLVGFALYVLHPDTWEPDFACCLEDLYVVDMERRKGVGTALLNALMIRARTLGGSKLYWHTHPQNQAACRLYEKFVIPDGVVRYTMRARCAITTISSLE